MLWLVGGVAVLVFVVAVLRGFASASPARLARILKWIGFALASGATIVLIARGNSFWALLGFAAAMAVLASLRWPRRGAAAGRTSDIETEWLRMSLDLDTGDTAGTVLKGRFAGATLNELSPEALLDLLGELRINDPQAALLLEAYLKRVHPDLGGETAEEPRHGASHGAMSRAEALEVLGLEDGASEEAIREAHRRLMRQVHPDAGGSDYLAAQINRARDVLLGG